MAVPLPPPGPGEVAVAVAAAAVNFPDVLLVAGRYQVSLEPPFVPGSEFAGTVIALGPGVDALAVGDVVHGAMLNGAFAEHIVMPATHVHALPTGIDLISAASFGVAHSTALDVLRSVAEVHTGEQLVVLGAGGGVGLAAVELGALLGAHVTAVASSRRKLDIASARGAVHLVDHTAAPLRTQLAQCLPDGADVVVDPVGGSLAEPALRSLRWGGRFVTVGYAAGEIPRIPLNLVLLKGVSVLGYQSAAFRQRRPDAAGRNDADLAAWLAAGRVRPHVGATFALEDVSAALAYVRDGRAIGKVVIEVGRGR